jgi:hypothetical protein
MSLDRSRKIKNSELNTTSEYHNHWKWKSSELYYVQLLVRKNLTDISKEHTLLHIQDLRIMQKKQEASSSAPAKITFLVSHMYKNPLFIIHGTYKKVV